MDKSNSSNVKLQLEIITLLADECGHTPEGSLKVLDYLAKIFAAYVMGSFHSGGREIALALHVEQIKQLLEFGSQLEKSTAKASETIQ